MKQILGNGDEVTAWKTEVDGLVMVNYKKVARNKSAAHWMLVHQPSGWTVASSGISRDQGKALAVELGELPIDWTLPSKDITGKQMYDLVMPVIRNFFEREVWQHGTLHV